jgi:hypothetical protein
MKVTSDLEVPASTINVCSTEGSSMLYMIYNQGSLSQGSLGPWEIDHPKVHKYVGRSMGGGYQPQPNKPDLNNLCRNFQESLRAISEPLYTVNMEKRSRPNTGRPFSSPQGSQPERQAKRRRHGDHEDHAREDSEEAFGETS